LDSLCGDFITEDLGQVLASVSGGELAGIQSYSSDLYPGQLLDDIEHAYEEGLVDPGYVGFDDVKRDLAMGKDRILARLADNPHRRLVEETVAKMGWWACFREDRRNRVKGTAEASANSSLSLASPSSQVRRATPKTGRNEQCPW
jgi:hypothetical protein